MTNDEIWKPVPETHYEASNLGRVRNKHTRNLVGTHVNAAGYHTLPGLLVHRAVLTAFTQMQPPHIVVRHLDGNRTNNRLENLAWGTRKENAEDTARAGRLRGRKGVIETVDPVCLQAALNAVLSGQKTQAEAAESIGRSQGWLSNRLRQEVQKKNVVPSENVDFMRARMAAEKGEEIWVVGVGLYGLEVSNLGRIRNATSHAILKSGLARPNGYWKTRDGVLLHRVVLESFSPCPFPGAVVRHNPNPDHADNRLCNLEWGTYADNAEDKTKHGTLLQGGKHPRAVLSDDQVKLGLERFVEENWTTQQLSDFLGDIGQGNAADIVLGKSWAHIPVPPLLQARRLRGTRRIQATDRPVTAKSIQEVCTRLDDQLDALREGNFQFDSDEHTLISRDELLLLTKAEGSDRLEQLVVPRIFTFMRTYVERWGWFYPPCDESLAEVLMELQAQTVPVFSGQSRTGTKFLKHAFPSFWHVQRGAVDGFHNDSIWRGVLRYRMGLNNSKPYTYKLQDGSSMEGQEKFDINLKNLRQGFIVQRQVPSLFKPAVARTIYQTWCPNQTDPVVWDPSGGFGSRLLGFASLFPQGTYIATEPAQETWRDLTRFGKELKQTGRIKDVQILKQGSETYQPEPESLDFVFTSPPYFDREQYFDEPGQCWRDYPTRSQWATFFVEPTLMNAYRGLKKGGRCVINISAALALDFQCAAHKIGFAEEPCGWLDLKSDALRKAKGHSEDQREPILVFVKNH